MYVLIKKKFSQAEFPSKYFEKKKSIFVFVLCGSVITFNLKVLIYVIIHEDVTKHMINKHRVTDGAITQLKMISGTHRIDKIYSTAESELFFPKKLADCTSSLGYKAKFWDKSSSA